jgi:HEAT repeat protein
MDTPRGSQARIRRHIDNLGDPDADVSYRAECYLIRYYGCRATEALTDACADPNPIVRFRAAWALGHTQDPRALEPLLRLMEDPDPRVRYDATLALGRLGDARAVEPLAARMASSGPEGSADCAAAVALAQIGPPAMPVLLPLLEHSIPEVRRKAAYALGRAGGEAVIEPLTRLLSHQDIPMRIAAVEALADIGTARCRLLLDQCASDPSEEVRRVADYWRRELAGPGDAAPQP